MGTEGFKKKSGLRERAMEEWDCIFVFTPERPELHILNMTTWVIMELCQGQSIEQLVREYQAFVGSGVPAERAEQQARKAVRGLERKGIVERVALKGAA